MSDTHRGHIVPTDTDGAQTTVSDIRTALTQRARLGDAPTVRTVIVDAADAIDATGLFSAFRRHRQAHYGWGDDPRADGDRYGDPYLGNYYDGGKDATYEPGEDEPAGDPDETVGHVYEVTIYYESRKTARVVAPDKAAAKEKLKYDELPDGKDVTGSVPECRRTHELHDETREIETVTRADSDLAERMRGWPW